MRGSMRKVSSKTDQRNLDLLRDYKAVFESEKGKRVLWDIMKAGFFLRSTVAGPGEDATTARNEGQRELVVYILSQLSKDEKKIYDFIMERERIAREDSDGLT